MIVVAVLAFIVFTASVAVAAARISAGPARSAAPATTATTLAGSASNHSPALTTPTSAVATRAVAPRLTAVPKDAFAAPAGGRSIDATTAEQVFRALYAVRSAAIFTHDDNTLSLIETGAARTYDLARCETCPTPPVTPATVPHQFSAPDQAGYPAFFAASVNRSGVDAQPVTEVVIFTRSDARAPWLVALDDSADSSNPLFDAGGGIGAAVPQVTDPDPRAQPAVLAAYWQQLWATGVSPSPSPFFQQPGSEDRRQGIIGSRDAAVQRGEQNDRRYYVDPHDGVYVVRALADQILACGAIRIQDDYTPIAMPTLVQPADRSEFGDAVAPGNYSHVRLSLIEEACFFAAAGGKAIPFETDPMLYASEATPIGTHT